MVAFRSNVPIIHLFCFHIISFLIRIAITHILCYNADAWEVKQKYQEGSHKHYFHPPEPGKVTILFHYKNIPKDTENLILKQAGLK